MLSLLTRRLSTIVNLAEINLVGRDFLSPRLFTADDLRSLLWTAMDIKCLFKQRNLNINCVESARISLVLERPCMRTQFAIKNATKLLNTNVQVLIDGENHVKDDEFGRFTSCFSDIIFCMLNRQEDIECIANGASVPVVGVKSCQFSLIKGLADIMTIHEYFEFTQCLIMAGVGLPASVLNTYFYLLPKFGINLRYVIENSQNLLECDGRKMAQQYNTEMHECRTVCQAVYRSNVISTSAHDDSNLKIYCKDVENASLKWALLHTLPRGKSEVEDAVFTHDNNLVWCAADNLKWIYGALILRLLVGHKATISEPCFERPDGMLN